MYRQNHMVHQIYDLISCVQQKINIHCLMLSSSLKSLKMRHLSSRLRHII